MLLKPTMAVLGTMREPSLKWKRTSNNSIFLFECSMWSLIVAGGWITCNSIDGLDILWITLPYFSDDMHVYTAFSFKGLKNKVKLTHSERFFFTIFKNRAIFLFPLKCSENRRDVKLFESLLQRVKQLKRCSRDSAVSCLTVYIQ